MAMNQTLWDKYWEILNFTEDYLKSGLRQQHPLPPQIRSPVSLAGEQFATAEEQLAALAGKMRQCGKCAWQENRQQVVSGQGAVPCRVLIVSDHPVAEPAQAAAPFSVRALGYLDKWLEAIALTRTKDCFLCSLTRCLAPGGRQPDTAAAEACLAYLEAQVKILQPRVILCTGPLTAAVITGQPAAKLSVLRGRRYFFAQVPVIVTYHPDTVLADQALRAAVWEDLKLLRAALQ